VYWHCILVKLMRLEHEVKEALHQLSARDATVAELRHQVSDLAAALERESAARQAAELRADQAEERCRALGVPVVPAAPVAYPSSLSTRRRLIGAFAAAASHAPAAPGSQCVDNDKDQEPAVGTAQASTTAAAAAGGTSTTSCTASPVVSYSCSEGVSGQETQQGSVSEVQQEQESTRPGQAQPPSMLLRSARMSANASSPVRPSSAHVSYSPTRCSPHPALKLASAPSGMPAAPAAEAQSPCVLGHSPASATPALPACSASPTPEPQQPALAPGASQAPAPAVAVAPASFFSFYTSTQPAVAAAGLSHVSPSWHVGGQVHFNLRVSYISSPGVLEHTSPAQLLGSDLMGLLGH
jgi:hypothetical protein